MLVVMMMCVVVHARALQHPHELPCTNKESLTERKIPLPVTKTTHTHLCFLGRRTLAHD